MKKIELLSALRVVNKHLKKWKPCKSLHAMCFNCQIQLMKSLLEELEETEIYKQQYETTIRTTKRK